MRKSVWIAILVFVVVIILLLLFAKKPSVVGHPIGETYELAQEETNVQTSAGTKNLPVGTLISVSASGVDYNYITLTQARTMLTTSGSMNFPVGSLIHCDPPPGMPSPCG